MVAGASLRLPRLRFSILFGSGSVDKRCGVWVLGVPRWSLLLGSVDELCSFLNVLGIRLSGIPPCFGELGCSMQYLCWD